MVVAVASQKGGSGKSTLTTGLAAALQKQQHQPIGIVDADPQRTTATWWECARQRPHYADVVCGANHSKVCGADLEKGRLWLIDCPGRLDPILRGALLTADLLLVPMQPSYADTWALSRLAEQVEAAVAHRRRPLPTYVVLNRVRRGTLLGRQAAGLAHNLPAGFQLLDAQLRELADFQLAMGHGLTPIEFNPRGRAAADLQQLGAAVLRILEGC